MENKCLHTGRFWYICKFNPICLLYLFIYVFTLYFYFWCVLVFLFPRLLQHAIQNSATCVPVSCYFHIKSRVFYSQADIFNTGEFKLHYVFVEAAQCKRFHLRRSNKLEKCSEKKKWKRGRMQFSESKAGIYTQAGGIGCMDWGRRQTSDEKGLGIITSMK